MNTLRLWHRLTGRFPVLALTMLSLLPVLLRADESQLATDEHGNVKMDADYAAVEVQSQSQVPVTALGNGDLQALAADIRNGEGASRQRRANYLWLRNRAKNKPLVGGKAATKVMRAALSSAWKQWREGSEQSQSHDYLPNSNGKYAISQTGKTDYQLGLDGNALHVDISVSASTAYTVRVDNDSAKLTYEYRF